MLTFTRTSSRHLWPAALLALACSAAPAEQAQNQNNQDFVSPNAILAAAVQTAQQIDGKQGDAVYAQTPAFVKQLITRANFNKGVVAERAKLGNITARQWLGIERVLLTAAANQQPVPCANVRFASLRGNTLAGVERVSLCWDQQQWRPTGYVAAQEPQQGGTP